MAALVSLVYRAQHSSSSNIIRMVAVKALMVKAPATPTLGSRASSQRSTRMLATRRHVVKAERCVSVLRPRKFSLFLGGDGSREVGHFFFGWLEREYPLTIEAAT